MQPIWDYDDVDISFQRRYLQTVLPLLSCALSLIVLGLQTGRKVWRSHREQKKQAQLVDVEEEEEEEDLTLQRTTSRASKVDVDRPRAEIALVGFECLLLLGQLAISVVEFRVDLPTYVKVAGTLTWAYVALLAGVRLCLSVTAVVPPFLRLWNHTALLYGLLWLFDVLVVRSQIVHPTDTLSRSLAVARFALTSCLLSVVLLSRKGNRSVELEYEGDVQPSREPLASIFSRVSFAWVDAIVWRGFQKPLELDDVWNVTVKDKADHVLSSFRQVKKTHMLAVELLLFFQKDLLIQGAWCALGSVAMFMPTLILKAILEYLEDPDVVPANTAWLYVTLLLVAGLVQAVGDGQGLWIGRKICIQLRAVIIGEIYSKILRRKAAAAADAELGKEAPKRAATQTLWKRVKSWKTKESRFVPDTTVAVKKATEAQANNGTVINLMSIDSFKVAEISAYLHFLWAAAPVQLALAVGLLYRVLGLSSLAGIVLMVLVLPLNMFIAKSFQSAQKRIMAATDARIHATNEVLQNIRIIKYFAWEQRFEQNVNEKRRVELTALWRKYVLWASAYTVWSAVPILITFTSFLVFTMVEKRPLVPSIAFPALSMFSLLRIPLDQLTDMVAHVQESKVSVDRVEEFLREEETEKYDQLKKSKQASPHETRIAVENATLTWGSKEEGHDSTDSFRLIDMDINFVVGGLNVIVGSTGAGKTSLLMALLGEMKLLAGTVHIPGGYSRQQLRPDPVTKLTESVAYCAQQAWLVNATIKENIIFASPFDSHRYQAVVAACALRRDLEILDAGDQTLVGEKGIALSGGQKQRISLARALYSNSKHLLLDDCLSAVDSHTAKHIVEEAIQGALMDHRTCVLVSHNVALTVPPANFVVVLDNGKIVAQGSPLQVMESGKLGEDLLKSRPPSRKTSAAPSRAPSVSSRESREAPTGAVQPNGHAGEAEEQQKQKAQFVDTRIEKKATGSIKWATIRMYLTSMGPWYYWIFAGTGFVAVQLGSVATNVWIRQWANAYHTSSSSAKSHYVHLFHQPAATDHATSGVTVSQDAAGAVTTHTALTSSRVDSVDAGYYLGVYAVLGLSYVLLCFGRELLLFYGSRRASWTVHERLLQRVLRATFKFFDSTPLGQLTNRFSKDIQAVDQEVAPVAIGMIHSAASVVTVVALISVVTPGFLIPGIFIASMYVATGLFYVRSSRDLKRLESVQRSPLFQHFGETLTGVVTIRAYGDEARFVRDSNTRVNTHNRPFIYLWATNRWLAFRIDVAGALVSFFSATFVILNVDSIDPGTAGLSLSYAITFTQNVLWLVRLYAANEQNMNAVERLQEYIDIEQEAPPRIPETQPAANWPSHGAVHFVSYSTSYRKDLDPVLRNLTFRIAAGEKVGIVGRTGAGKSSLALALFRGLEADSGKILIDDVDIGLIGLQDLREAITIVPQDPTLFTGTMRTNLDPFGLFTDEEIFTALRRVQLISSPSKTSASSESGSSTPSSTPTLKHDQNSSESETGGPLASTDGTTSTEATVTRFASNSKDNKNVFYNLSSPVTESGSNLSQGQRQLLCLARALLKSPKVLVMDEATASIDYATDAKIQNTLRELKDNTIITIAHRLQTIIDYDKVLVLDKGELIEYAHPWELIQKEEGVFRSMCETSGDLDVLEDMARRAWDAQKLVDV